jgi:hypothetical protein
MRKPAQNTGVVSVEMNRGNRGHFRRGYDPRRHIFTREECQEGFWAAITSIVIRYPDAVDASGRHMACDFLKAARRRNEQGDQV